MYNTTDNAGKTFFVNLQQMARQNRGHLQQLKKNMFPSRHIIPWFHECHALDRTGAKWMSQNVRTIFCCRFDLILVLYVGNYRGWLNTLLTSRSCQPTLISWIKRLWDWQPPGRIDLENLPAPQAANLSYIVRTPPLQTLTSRCRSLSEDLSAQCFSPTRKHLMP